MLIFNEFHHHFKTDYHKWKSVDNYKYPNMTTMKKQHHKNVLSNPNGKKY